MVHSITAFVLRTTIKRLHTSSSLCTRGGWCLHVLLPSVTQSRIVARQQQRHLLTAINEPSPDTTLQEHPCTLILAEDQDFYETSWQPLLTEILTPQGISHACLTLSSSSSSSSLPPSPENCSTVSMDQALTGMASDLMSIPQVVLVARGPWMSWMAQLYLESLAVAGLVLVDPLLLDDQNSVNQFQLAYQKRNLQSGTNYKLFQECMEHWGHWTLRLEPGAVPMMVISSQSKRGFVRAAENTVRRHAPDIAPDSPWDMSSSIPLVKLDLKKDQQAQGVEALQGIVEWMDAHVV